MRFRDFVIAVRFGMLMSEALVDHRRTVHECRDLLNPGTAIAMPCWLAARPLLTQAAMNQVGPKLDVGCASVLVATVSALIHRSGDHEVSLR